MGTRGESSWDCKEALSGFAIACKYYRDLVSEPPRHKYYFCCAMLFFGPFVHAFPDPAWKACDESIMHKDESDARMGIWAHSWGSDPALGPIILNCACAYTRASNSHNRMMPIPWADSTRHATRPLTRFKIKF